MTMITFAKNRFAPISLIMLVSVLALGLAGAGTPSSNNAQTPWTQSRASQLVFFAVLEGLYRDGLSNETVDLIIPPGENGKGRFEPEHFVYTCPLCHPAYEAFKLYRQREEFYGF